MIKQRAALATILSGFVFFTNCALVYSLETNLWEERRSHQLASLPVVLKPISSVLSDTQSNISPLIPAALQPLAKSLPSAYAHIEDHFVSGDPSEPTVVILQDVHLNQEAQTNLGKVLLELINNNQLGAVGVEGSFRKFNFEPFRKWPDQKAANLVINSYHNSGRLAAASFAGLTSAVEPPSFVGIDDKDHYALNVKAYLDSQENKPHVLEQLQTTERDYLNRRAHVFSPALLRFDSLRSAYHEGRLPLGAYLKNLSAYEVDHDMAVDQFLEAFEMERKLNFQQVEAERSKVIVKLASVLSEKENAGLISQSLAYRLGNLSFGRYYQRLKNLCEQKQISLRSTPAFDDYLRYVLLCDGINARDLIESVGRLESSIVEALAKTSEEKELAAFGEKIGLTKKLMNFSLTPAEWDKYKLLKKETVDLSSFEQFYIEADIRSEKMVSNLLAHESKRTALVVGGFHTPHMTKQLRERKISYLVISPKITKIDDASGSAYLSIFAQQRTPLEKLFEGKKLFLKPRGFEIDSPVALEMMNEIVPDRKISILNRLHRHVKRIASGSLLFNLLPVMFAAALSNEIKILLLTGLAAGALHSIYLSTMNSSPSNDSAAATKARATRGLKILGSLMQKPKDFDWSNEEATLPPFQGEFLGTTGHHGYLRFSPLQGVRFTLTATDEPGWNVFVTEAGVKNGIYEFTVTMTKTNEKDRSKTFHIGRYPYKQKEKETGLLDVTDEWGSLALCELMRNPADFNWEKEKHALPNIDGKKLGKTGVKGELSFTPFPFFSFHWRVATEAGWDVEVTEAEVKNGVYTFTVTLTKENHTPQIKTYHMGRYPYEISGSRKEKGRTETVLAITDEWGNLALAELMMKPPNFDWEKEKATVPIIAGQKLGTTVEDGILNIRLAQFFWMELAVLGIKEAGWDVVVTDARVKDGFYEFAVLATKKGELPRARAFRIGSSTHKTSGHYEKTGEVLEYLKPKIDRGWALRALAELVQKPPNFNWEKEKGNLPNLVGHVLGETNNEGALFVRPFPGFRYSFSVLGLHEAGWTAIVTEAGVKKGLYELTVLLIKKGQPSKQKKFHVGRYTHTLHSLDRKVKSTEKILRITPIWGRLALSELIRKPTNFEWEKEWVNLPNLIGHYLGRTDGQGRLDFSPAKNYLYQWAVLGFGEADWHVTVKDAQLKDGLYELTVTLSKGNDSFERKFYIGRADRKILGIHTEKNSLRPVLNIVSQEALQKLRHQFPKGTYNFRTESIEPIAKESSPLETLETNEFYNRIDGLNLNFNQRNIVERILAGEDISDEFPSDDIEETFERLRGAFRSDDFREPKYASARSFAVLPFAPLLAIPKPDLTLPAQELSSPIIAPSVFVLGVIGLALLIAGYFAWKAMIKKYRANQATKEKGQLFGRALAAIHRNDFPSAIKLLTQNDEIRVSSLDQHSPSPSSFLSSDLDALSRDPKFIAAFTETLRQEGISLNDLKTKLSTKRHGVLIFDSTVTEKELEAGLKAAKLFGHKVTIVQAEGSKQEFANVKESLNRKSNELLEGVAVIVEENIFSKKESGLFLNEQQLLARLNSGSLDDLILFHSDEIEITALNRIRFRDILPINIMDLQNLLNFTRAVLEAA